MNSPYAAAPAPTWRLCHPVNIYCFKNGVCTEKPQLIHIPMEMKKNMTTVLDAIALRMKLVVGYPIALYNMDGTRVCKTYELNMYSYYVVVTSTDQRFKCVDYGNVKEPLVVIGHSSKHVKTLKMQNKRFDLFCKRKMRKRLHELVPHGEKNGLGPCDLPAIGPPCGALCTKIAPLREQPTQVCSDEIMSMEGKRPVVKKAVSSRRDYGPPGYCAQMQDRELAELARHVRENKTGQSKHMMDLIQRYQHVGSDIFKLFQDRINEDAKTNRSASGNKWNLTGGGTGSLGKIKDELQVLAQASCQIAFDQYGNFIGSPQCPVPTQTPTSPSGHGGGGAEREGKQGDDIPFASYNSEPQQRSNTPVEGRSQGKSGGAMSLSQEGASGKSLPKANDSAQGASQQGSSPANQASASGGSHRTSYVVNSATVEVDQENNISIDQLGNERGPSSSGSKVQRSSKQEVSITEVMSRKASMLSSADGSIKPSDMTLATKANPSEVSGIDAESKRTTTRPSREMEADADSEDDGEGDGGGTRKGSKRKSRKSGKSDKSGKGGKDTQAMSMYGIEARNPWLDGGILPPPFSPKVSKEKTWDQPEDSLHKYWFHSGGQHPKDGGLLKGILPPEGYDVITNNKNRHRDFPPSFQSSSNDWFPSAKAIHPAFPDIFHKQVNDMAGDPELPSNFPPPDSPPTPPPPPLFNFCRYAANRTDSSATFIIHKKQEEADRENRIFYPPINPTHHHTRNVRAQAGSPTLSTNRVQMRESEMDGFKLPSEDELPTVDIIDEKPVGIYEGYQESIKVKSSSENLTTVISDFSSEDEDRNTQRQERKYRREKQEQLRKRKRESIISVVPSEYANPPLPYTNSPSSTRRMPAPQHPNMPQQAFLIQTGNGNQPRLQFIPQQQQQPPLAGTVLLRRMPVGNNNGPSPGMPHIPWMNRIVQPPPSPTLPPNLMPSGYPLYQRIMVQPAQQQQQPQQTYPQNNAPAPTLISTGTPYGSPVSLIRIPAGGTAASRPGVPFGPPAPMYAGSHRSFPAPANVNYNQQQQQSPMTGKLVRFSTYPFPSPGPQYYFSR